MHPSDTNWIEPVEPRLLLATIAGNIYIDLNANGVREVGDRSHTDGVAWVDLNGDGQRAGEPYAVADSQTGDYVITGVPAGTYRVGVLRTSGYRITEPSEDGFYPVTIKDKGESFGGFNFGMAPSTVGTVKGVVLHDRDGDGQRDPTDTPLAGWTLFLDKANFGVLDPDERRATTAADGGYRFDDVPAGAAQQRITLLVPDGWRTYQPPGGDNPLPVRTATIEGGGLVTADFFNTPFETSPYLDPTFGVGGVLSPVNPIVLDARSYDFHDFADGPGSGDGFFALGYDGLFKFRDDGGLDPSFDAKGRDPFDRAFDLVASDTQGRAVLGRDVVSGVQLRRYNADGTIDATFGDDGTQTFNVGWSLAELLVRPDGRAVFFADESLSLVVGQMNAAGTEPDRSFGAGGVARFGFGDKAAVGMALAPDNKLIVVTKRDAGWAVYRLTPFGQLDTSFSDDGQLLLDYRFTRFTVGDIASVADVAVRGDGKILLAVTRGQPAFDVVRLTAAGAIDTTFGGGDGVASVTFPRKMDGAPAPGAAAREVALDAAGRIVVAGVADAIMRDQTELAAVRLMADGSLDATYGDGGRVLAPASWNEEAFRQAFLDSDGRLVADVYINHTFNDSLVRLLPEPTPLNVGGLVFNDLDEDGVHEPGEPGLPGFTVFIDRDGDGQFDDGEPSTATNARGSYALAVPANEAQRVAVVRPDGWSFVAPAGGARTVTVAAGKVARDADFAMGDLRPPRLLDAEVRLRKSGVWEAPEWVVRFDEPIAPSSIVPGAFQLLNRFHQPIPITAGQLSFDPDLNAVMFRPNIGSGAYRFSVLADGSPGGLTDLSGNPLQVGLPHHGLLYAWGELHLRKTETGEIVVSNSDEVELARMPAAEVDTLLLVGTTSSDRFRIDLAGGNPLAGDALIVPRPGAVDMLQIDGDPEAANRVAFSATGITIDGIRAETPGIVKFTFDGRGGGDDVVSISRTSLQIAGRGRRFESLTLTDGALVGFATLIQGGDRLAVSRDLTIDETSRLRLDDTDLILQATPETRDALLAATVAHVRRARDGVSGGGISAPAPPLAHLVATPNPGLARFRDVPVDQHAILLTVTYTGDANLDGLINADDYFRIDQAFLAQPASPTYFQGDINFDGLINADDYFLIDQAFLGQGAPLGGGGDSSLRASPAHAKVSDPTWDDGASKRKRRAIRKSTSGRG